VTGFGVRGKRIVLDAFPPTHGWARGRDCWPRRRQQVWRSPPPVASGGNVPAPGGDPVTPDDVRLDAARVADPPRREDSTS